MPRPTLPPRLRQVLKMVNAGDTNETIATRLGIDSRSAQRYVSLLYSAIGGDSRIELVERARSLDLVPTPKRGGLQRVRLRAIERKVLHLLAGDRTPLQIATILGKSRGVVQEAILHLRASFGVRDNLALVDRAVDMGLVEVPKPVIARNMLTKRECEILDRLALGLSHAQIGADLGLSKTAISGRINNMRAKLNVVTIEELLDEVERRGLHAFDGRRRARVARAHVGRVPAVDRAAVRLTPRANEVLHAFARWPKRAHQDHADHFGISKAAISHYSVEIQRRLGVRTMAAAVERALALGMLSTARPTRDHRAARANLTQRQFTVLVLLNKGQSIRHIARSIGVAPRNIATTVRTLVRRLRASSPADAVRIAREQQVLS